MYEDFSPDYVKKKKTVVNGGENNAFCALKKQGTDLAIRSFSFLLVNVDRTKM